MFYSILPITIILISLVAIILIVFRKFPQLTALEVEKIVEVKQAKIKEAIQRQKFERSLLNFGQKISHWFKKLQVVQRIWLGIWQAAQEKFRIFVHDLKERHKKLLEIEIERRAQEAPKPEMIEETKDLLRRAEEALERKDYSFAERQYIEVARREPKNIEAYRGLGKVYFGLGRHREAAETFNFLLKLKPDDVRAFNRLGMMAEEEGRWEDVVRYFEEAVKLDSSSAIRFFDLGRAYASLNKPAMALTNFSRAAEIEPNNPKYLDQVLEMSIITRDKDLAQETLRRLEAVNPENQKLAEFKNRIEKLE